MSDFEKHLEGAIDQRDTLTAANKRLEERLAALIEACSIVVKKRNELEAENAEMLRHLRNIIECASPYDQEGPLDKVMAGHCVITYTVDGTWIDEARALLSPDKEEKDVK